MQRTVGQLLEIDVPADPQAAAKASAPAAPPAPTKPPGSSSAYVRLAQDPAVCDANAPAIACFATFAAAAPRADLATRQAPRARIVEQPTA